VTDIAKILGSSASVVAASAAMAIGFGVIPSSADLKRVEAQASKVAGIETVVAVQAKQIETIEKTVARIEDAQTVQFERVMKKLDTFGGAR